MVCVDPHDIPVVAFIDPEMMASMPKGLTAATGMDALTHAIEGYITADLKDIVKREDIPFLAQSAYDDACRPGNPKETSVEDITKLYESLL